MIELRAHHGMCLYYFKGEGYSTDFTKNMAKIKALLSSDDPLIRIVTHADCICSNCPNNHLNICASEEKVSGYDQAVLAYCGLEASSVMHFQEFEASVIKNILLPHKRNKICGNCQWNELCQ